MRKLLTRFIDAIVMIVGTVIIAVYRALFGWWLSEMLTRRTERRLQNRTRQAFIFLFEDQHATFVPLGVGYERTKGKMIIVESSTLRLRITRDKNEDGVEIAPLHAPTNWKPLRSALAAVTAKRSPVRSPEDLHPFPPYPDLFQLGDSLKAHISAIEEAYSKRNYPSTELAIDIVQRLPGYNPPSLGRFTRILKSIEHNNLR